MLNLAGSGPRGINDFATVPKSGEELTRALARENFKLEDLHEQCNGWFYDKNAESCRDEVIKEIDQKIKQEFARSAQLYSLPAGHILVRIKNAEPNGFVRSHFRDRNFTLTFVRMKRNHFGGTKEQQELTAIYGKDQSRWPQTALFYIVSLLPENSLNWQEKAAKRI